MHLDLTALLLKHEVIFNILQEDNEESKLVGGCVRDFLIYGIISEDTDVSTTLSPQAVILKLQKYKHKHNDVNCIILDKDIRYGTIVAIINKIIHINYIEDLVDLQKSCSPNKVISLIVG